MPTSASQVWLDNRSPLRRKLDEIRSRGLLEHRAEWAGRQFERLQVSHYEPTNDNRYPLLRGGPWYMSEFDQGECRKAGEFPQLLEDALQGISQSRHDEKLLQAASKALR